MQDYKEPDDKALQRIVEPKDLPPAMAAMAEALRANAEALRRIDATQRKMADSMERSDKAQQVVASTRALNETFRGLSEIQRGLLDAVVRGRGGGSGGAGTPFIFFAVAILAALAGVLIYQEWTKDENVSRAVYEEARRSTDRLAKENSDLSAQLKQAGERDRDYERRLTAKDQSKDEVEKARAELDKEIQALQKELAGKNARLEEYLSVRAQAEMAGTLQIQNMSLEREVRDLKEKLDGLQKERREMYGYFGDKLLELRGGDPEEIKAIAKKLGLWEEPEPPPALNGPLRLTATMKRQLLQQVNRLLPDAEEAYDLIALGGLAEGWRFEDVTLTRHVRGRLVNSFKCKELTILVDADEDTIEVRLKDGYMTNTGRPNEKIPLGAGGHSIFLPEAGIRTWLRRLSGSVEVDAKGRLTWKSTPS